MSQQLDAREIRAMLQQRLDGLLLKLFPGHQVTRPVFSPLNPTRNDRKPGSFVIWTAGAAMGGFNEYSPNGPPASGDVIDLIAYVHRSDRKFAFDFARDFLGIKAMDARAIAAAKTAARSHAQQATQQQSEAAAFKRRRANELWQKTMPLAGSVAETYLASRRIPLVLVANREGDLRFMPRLEHWKSGKWEDSKKLSDGPFCPAMVAAMRNGAGDITAVHCTFLRADGSGKADVSEPKLMRGSAKGSAIRLTRGPDNLAVEDATGVIGPLVIAEGIENGLSVAMATPEARVFAAGSFDLMLALDVSAAIFDPVIYALDNDADPKAAEAVADHIDALRAAGKTAGAMRAAGVKDFNDLVRA